MAEELRVAAGALLAAWPDLMDPNFMHSVVVICQHSEEGAYGLVTNRRTKFAVRDLLPDHPLLSRCGFPVHLGGPVDHSTLQFLHRVPGEIPGGLCLDGQLWLGGELEAMGRYATERPDEARRTLRVFLGYSGWGAGQLEAELGMQSWLPAPSSLDVVFGEEGEPAWRRVVRSIGRDGGGFDQPDVTGLEDLPPDVHWN